MSLSNGDSDDDSDGDSDDDESESDDSDDESECASTLCPILLQNVNVSTDTAITECTN